MKTKMMRVLMLAVLMVAMLVLPVAASAAATPVGTEAELRTALEDGGEIVLTANITLSSTAYINKPVVIDGAGYTIDTANKKLQDSFRLNDATSGRVQYDGLLEVTFKNVTIKNSHDQGRPIHTRGGKFDLTIDNCTLTRTGAGNNGALQIGGMHTGLQKVTVTESTLNGGQAGYAILTWNPVEMTVTNTYLEGYAAYYAQKPNSSTGSRGSKVDFIGCTAKTEVNYSESGQNSFATFVVDDEEVTVTLTNCDVIAHDDGTAVQSAFAIRAKAASGSTITLKSANGLSNTINAENLWYATAGNEDGLRLSGNVDLKSNMRLGAPIDLTDDVVIDGGYSKFKITSSASNGKAFTINKSQSSSQGTNVTFQNVVIEAPLRAIDTRGGQFNLTVKNSTLKATASSGDRQPLTIGGASHDGLPTVKVENSVIDANTTGYAIVTFNPVKLDVIDTTINAWCAYYGWEANGSEGSAGSEVTFDGCEINCSLNLAGESNSFGVFVLRDQNITLDVMDTEVNAKNAASDAEQRVVIFDGGFGAPENCDVTIGSGCTLNAEELYYVEVPDNQTPKAKNNKLQVACDVVMNLAADPVYGTDAYGNNVSIKHAKVVHHQAKAASYSENGNLEHYDCEACGKCYKDAAMTEEVKHDDMIIKFVESHGSTTEITEHAVENAVSTGVMDVHQADDILTTDHVISGVEVSAENFDDLTQIKTKTLTIKLDTADVAIDSAALKTINAAAVAAGADSIKLEVKVNEANILSNTQNNAIKNENVAAVISAEWLLVGKNSEKKFTDNFDGKVTVTFPFDCAAKGVSPEDCTLYWLKDDGTLEAVKAKFDGKTCSVTLKHFSEYVVITDASDSDDAADSDDASASADGLDTLPKTGDNSQIFLWAGMLMISLCALAMGKKVRV